jgi:dephospho-CoA kinase
MLKVGITGGIGSGKSTVCQVFETLGIPVLYADGIARKLMESDPLLRKQIIALFGKDAYIEHQLNRVFLSQIVFKDKEKLAQLNAITHPAVITFGEDWMNAHEKAPYVLKEAALFFETGSDKNMDLMIGVSAPFSLRVQRTIERDIINEDAVLARIAQQMNEEEKMSRCQKVIYNNDQDSIIDQVLSIHHYLMAMPG